MLIIDTLCGFQTRRGDRNPGYPQIPGSSTPLTWSPTSDSPKNTRQIFVSVWQVRIVEVVCLFVLHLTGSIIAYPDGHPDSGTDRETEFRYLKAKVDAGADFIVTQLFYDVGAFLEWVKKIRAGGSVSLPTKFI